MAENNLIVYKVQVDTASGKIAIDGLTKGFVSASTAVNKLKVEMDALAKSTQGVGTASGIAGAFVNEFGRFVSDLPYGIQAVSNNISQLGSLFAVMAVSAGSAKKAFEDIKETLKTSPILLYLLAFQALVAVVTYLDKQISKTTKSVNEMAQATGSAASSLKIAKEALQDENVSLEEKQKIMKSIKKEYKDLEIVLNDKGVLDEKSLENINKEILALEKLAKAKVIQKLIEAELVKIAEAQAKRAQDNLDLFDKILVSIGSGISTGNILLGIQSAGLNAQKDIINQAQDSIKNLNDILKGEGLIGLLFNGEDPKKAKEKREKNLRQNLLDFSSEIDRFNKAGEVKAVEFEEQKLLREGLYAQKSFTNEYNLFLAKEELRYKSALLSAKTDSERAQIEATWQQTQLQALQEYNEATYALTISLANREAVIEEKKQARIREIVMQGMSSEAAFKVQMATNDFDRINAELDAQKIAHETRMALLEEERQARIDAGYETSEIDAKINNEKNDNAAKSAKIQRELELSKLDVISQVGQAAIEIAGEGSAIGKAVAVAMAIMNTREAITNALGAKPYGPWNIAQAVAVGAAGFAQVRGIMAQQLPVASKGGGAGAPSVQAPDFNIVGANQTNQLASAIQGQFNSPIKAYVVAKDVSTAQELDRNVVNAASIG